MATPLRTNPALAHLAYRKTITARAAAFLRRQYLGDEMSGPREVLVCEEVFPVDSQVPPEAVQEYIEQLNEEIADLDLQIRRFELVAPRQGQHEQKKQKGPKQQRPQGGQGNRQGGRAH